MKCSENRGEFLLYQRERDKLLKSTSFEALWPLDLDQDDCQLTSKDRQSVSLLLDAAETIFDVVKSQS